MLERDFQRGLIKRLKEEFPDCMVIKLDPNYIQGLPDLLVLHGDKWACLEVKRSPTASVRPNQRYYVDKLNSMSYATFINPENYEEVIHELQQTFQS